MRRGRGGNGGDRLVEMIATSHEFLGPQMVVKSKAPAISGISRMVKYYNLARSFHHSFA